MIDVHIWLLSEISDLVDEINNPVLKVIHHKQNYYSSIVIYVVKAASLYFYFEHITAGDISQQIKRLDITKATQEIDTPTKLVKRFDTIIVDYLQENFNNCPKLS